jgi:hypothetical protein
MIIGSLLYNSRPKDKNPGLVVNYVFYLIVATIMVAAVLLSLKCNQNQPFWPKIGYAVLAAFFPEIYIIQSLLRKYVFKEAGYCSF